MSEEAVTKALWGINKLVFLVGSTFYFETSRGYHGLVFWVA